MKFRKIVAETPFAIGPVNLYLIEDDQLALIDTGPKTDEAIDALNRGLGAAGYSLSDIDLVILTHAHEDHYGLARFIKDRSQAKLLTHKANVQFLTNWKLEFPRLYEISESRLLHNAGVPDDVIASMRPLVDILESSADQVEVDRALEDGDVIYVGNTRLDVIHTPGHSPGSICLYSAEDNSLFSGDHLLAHVSSNAVIDTPLDGDNGRPRSLSEYIESLHRIESMDLSIIYTSHGEDIFDHRSLIESRIQFYEHRKRQILAALGGSEKTPYQLATALFAELHPFEVFLAVSEVIGHLDLLEDDGKVTWRNDNGVFRFRRA